MTIGNVFINCPYDKDYESSLHAIIFTCIALDLNPILSKIDSYNSIRIKNIEECIRNSCISIHDLSIMGSSENSRYNMPLEIGMSIMYYFLKSKEHKIIILEPETYLTQKCCSDLNAFDPILYKKEDGIEGLINCLAESILNIIGQRGKLEPYEIFNLYLEFETYLYDNKIKGKTLNSMREHMKNFINEHLVTKHELNNKSLIIVNGY